MATYRCVACNVYFASFEEQRQHYFSIHQNQPRHPYMAPAAAPPPPPVFSTVNSYSRPYPSNYGPNMGYVNETNGYFPQRNYVHKIAPRIKRESMNCDVCEVKCTGQNNYDLHVQGRKHMRNANKSATSSMNGSIANSSSLNKNDIDLVVDPDLYCSVCEITCQTIDQFGIHLNGMKHKKKTKFMKYNELKSQKDPSVYCEICDQFMTEDVMIKHRESGTHKRKNTGKSENTPSKKAKVEALTTDISVERCGFCNIDFATHQEAVYHYQSSKHIANFQNRTKNFNLWCDICQVSFHSQDILDKHVKGFKHYARINRGVKNPEGELASKLISQRLKIQALKHKRKNDDGNSPVTANEDQ